MVGLTKGVLRVLSISQLALLLHIHEASAILRLDFHESRIHSRSGCTGVMTRPNMAGENIESENVMSIWVLLRFHVGILGARQALQCQLIYCLVKTYQFFRARLLKAYPRNCATLMLDMLVRKLKKKKHPQNFIMRNLK